METKDIKEIKIKKDSLGGYFVHYYVKEYLSNTRERQNNGKIGIDIGFNTFLVFSNGEKLDWPHFVQEYFDNLKRMNSIISEATRRKEDLTALMDRIRRSHRSFMNKRDNFYWEVSHNLCKMNEYIFVEDLDYRELCISHGRKTKALAFSNFMRILNECAAKYGTSIIKVDKYYPSSKLCSD